MFPFNRLGISPDPSDNPMVVSDCIGIPSRRDHPENIYKRIIKTYNGLPPDGGFVQKREVEDAHVKTASFMHEMDHPMQPFFKAALGVTLPVTGCVNG
jgi:hypothetical protein